MSYRILLTGWIFLVLMAACSSSDPMINKQKVDDAPDERISLNINQTVYFEFIKTDTVWAGELMTYALGESGEKVVNKVLISAQDSSWNDFNEFVNFLRIMELPPQNEIEGWVPDSGNLPKRVYNFEVFDGDTTRSFSYQDPINDIRDFWQSQNLLTFITFVENDLRWVEVTDTGRP
ncbi:MAG: hypothetical protein WD357_06950 [Gracilimonas sp.]